MITIGRARQGLSIEQRHDKFAQSIFYSLAVHMLEKITNRVRGTTSSLGSLTGGLPGHSCLSFGVGVVAFCLGCTRREARKFPQT